MDGFGYSEQEGAGITQEATSHNIFAATRLRFILAGTPFDSMVMESIADNVFLPNFYSCMVRIPPRSIVFAVLTFGK
jgi:hypothetical protein